MSVERAKKHIGEVRDFLAAGLFFPGEAKTALSGLDAALRELQPEPKVIDWQKVVDNQLPVMVSMDDGKRFPAFLRKYEPPYFPFKASACGWKYATLETGQWVFNSAGENPWPGGVRIEVWLKNGVIWDLSGQELSILKWKHDILASRAVGLEEGWSYGY